MIEAFLRTIDNVVLKIPYIISFQFWSDEDVPADLLVIEALTDKLIPKSVTLEVTIDGKLFFTGIIDEQITGMRGTYFESKLIARSKAALLLDNQARPQLYSRLSLSDLFERHIKPYGFLQINSPQNKTISNFLVKRGMSEWDVLSTFCKLVGLQEPYVLLNGAIEVNGRNSAKTIKFSNNSKEQPFCDINVLNRRAQSVSQVFIKHGCDYQLCVPDLKATSHVIFRKRYFESKFASKQDKLAEAEAYLKSKNKLSFLVNIVVPQFIDVGINDRVLINHKKGQFSDLIVCGFKYEKNKWGSRTHLKLRETR